ncbi:hypothetical protein FOZ63_009438, partial [Perkinsus olseni]
MQYLSPEDRKKLQQDLVEHGIHHACRGIKVGADGGTYSNITAALRRQFMLPQDQQLLRGAGVAIAAASAISELNGTMLGEIEGAWRYSVVFPCSSPTPDLWGASHGPRTEVAGFAPSYE